MPIEETDGVIIERLEELEVKAAELADVIRSLRSENARLIEENEGLRRDATRTQELERKNEALSARISEMKGRITEYTEKEDLITNKLKTILDRVEEVEGEIDDLEGKSNE